MKKKAVLKKSRGSWKPHLTQLEILKLQSNHGKDEKNTHTQTMMSRDRNFEIEEEEKYE